MELLPLITALVAGFVHALEPDHMAAVTTFVSRRPRPAEAVGFGVRWGLGHSGAILLVGTALIALDLRVPDLVARGLEFGVGAMLVVLGAILLWNVAHERAHRLAASPEGGREDHPHRHGSLWVGVAHGLAGTAPLAAIVAVSMAGSPWLAGAYLLLFGVGTTAAMGIYAVVAGLVFHHAGARVPALRGTFRAVTALGSAALGVFWMAGAVGGA